MKCMKRFVDFVYNMLAQPWKADWRIYALSEEDYEELQRKLKENGDVK